MRLGKLTALALAAIVAVPAHAQQRITYVEEWVEIGGQRYVAAPSQQAESRAIAAYGPFRVLDARTAALVGVTDRASPAQFAAMLRDFPALGRLELLECPGTEDDLANLRLGRMIRTARLATSVPAGGSVRSGGIELFLAGVTREAADAAEFAVHAWEDEDGRQASDFPLGAPQNAKYLAYYREMGMSDRQAKAFYAMTNAAPFESARWLDGAEMRTWLGKGEDGGAGTAAPTPIPLLAYLDLGVSLN